MLKDQGDLEDWRDRRRERVGGPDGWLSVVGLAWLHQGDNPVGSDPSNPVRLPSGPAQAGTIEVGPSEVVFVETDGRRTVLEHDPAVEPTTVRLGPVSLFVIERHGGLAVRIRNSESLARVRFAGLDYFPMDRSWRKEARFEPYEPAGTIALPTQLGGEERYGLPGRLEFEAGGATHRLDAYDEAGAVDLFIMFGDLTNREETFGGGRYMYAERPGPDGLVVLDFNRSYNPPCVFSPHTTCSLPLPGNHLPIRVEAGELRYRGEVPPMIEMP
jgi:uncharacterized protein (DUF1684 family)